MGELFNTFIHDPLYNGLIALLSLGSWVDLGIAIILLTILVKLALLPISLKAARYQQLLKKLEAPMKEIREKYKDNREEQGRKMLELYREHKANPLTGIFLLFIQLPIIIGLYFVFFREGFPELRTDILYSWTPIPDMVRMQFLGFLDVAGKSLPLALLVGLSQYVHAKLAFPAPSPRKEGDSFQEDFARSMQMNMRYVFPVMMAVFAYYLKAGVALYWITSNIFSIGQEYFVKRQLAREATPQEK